VYSQDSTRRLRLERHEDDSIEHLPSLVRSFPGPVQTVKDCTSEDQVGRSTDCRPEDHHGL
jgi:hypothetical protein